MITARVRRRSKKRQNNPVGHSVPRAQADNYELLDPTPARSLKGPGEAKLKRPLRTRKDQAPHLRGTPEDIIGHQDAFLAIFRVTGNITTAAKACGFRRSCIFDWSKFDESGEWDERFQEAREEAADLLEEAARVRAVDGIKEPVYNSQGKLCGYVTRYSDQLLRILLKANRPGKFGEHVQVQNNHTIDLKPMLDQVMQELQGNGNFLEYARNEAEASKLDHQDSEPRLLGSNGNVVLQTTSTRKEN